MGGGLPQMRIVAVLAALFAIFAASASARPWSGRGAAVDVVSWQAPTPAAGAQIATRAGTRLTIALAASATAGSPISVHIASRGLPMGARLVSSDGSPATATFTWTPTPAQAGSHAITFTASSTTAPEAAAEPRQVEVLVRAGEPTPPPPRRRSKPKTPAVQKLSGVNHTYRYAKLLRAAVARSAPRRSAHVVDRIPFLTPENTQNLVALLELRRIHGKEWVKVRLATLPNNSTGWLRRGDLGAFRRVRTRLVVNRSAFTATLYRAGKKVFRAPVGVGRPHWPTPRGEYYIRMKLCCYDNPTYGPYAFGLSARSAVLTDWPGGGYIGIHGTNAPGLIPGRISHGCIRMRNADITRLNRLAPAGTPVTVL
jgi:L,D-transpeptidase-like protein